MTTEALLRLHTARPFQPASLRRVDGQAQDQPEMLAYTPRARTATVYFNDGAFELVGLLLASGFGSAAR